MCYNMVMKKVNIPIIIGVIIILVCLIIVARNDNKFDELNSELASLGVEEYSGDDIYVRFRTIDEMDDLIKSTKEAYNDEITAMQDVLIAQINESNLFAELEYLITEIDAINNDVNTMEEYNTSMEQLEQYELEIKQVESAAAMTYFINDTKEYMETNFTADELSTISIGFVNLETKQEVYFNSDYLFYSASTIKVPINMYVYDLIAAGEASLDDTVVFTEEYYEGGTGIMQADPYGTVYTIDYVLTQSIVTSDNVATNMLIDLYFENPNNLIAELEPYWGYCNLDNTTDRECSVTNHITSLTYLYDHSEQYELLIQDMKDSVFKDMVPKYITDEVEVANKVGMMGAILIDDAIVYADTPYAISMAFVGIENAEERMALLSEEIYNNWVKYMG